MFSREAELFINHCFKDGQVRVIMPVIGESYDFPNIPKPIKFSSKILEEIKQSPNVKVKMVNDKTAMIMGTKHE